MHSFRLKPFSWKILRHTRVNGAKLDIFRTFFHLLILVVLHHYKKMEYAVYMYENLEICQFQACIHSQKKTAHQTEHLHLSECWAVFIQLDYWFRWWYAVKWAVSSESVVNQSMSLMTFTESQSYRVVMVKMLLRTW